MSRREKIEEMKQSIIKEIQELMVDRNISEIELSGDFEGSDYDASHGGMIKNFITKLRLNESGEVQGYFENPNLYKYYPFWESLDSISVEQLEDMLMEIEDYEE